MTDALMDDTSPRAGQTRRTFIRGIAATGASTAAAAVALERAGIADLFAENAAAAAPAATPFSDFTAIAPSSADAFQVPEGYRADVLMRAGDAFVGDDGAEFSWGYNNDFLAFFPLDKAGDEGLLYSNFEYPDPFFLHGERSGAAKTVAQIEIERESVGTGVLHVRRDGDGLWRVVSPSPYNRRTTGAGPTLEFTGPLADNPAYPGVGETVDGSLANCSGGITPWGTALSCEENYQDYGTASGYGWTPEKVGTNQYVNGNGSSADSPAKFGWVVEQDPYDPSDAGRKHTALGRFRHENTAFNATGATFVLYMGDDRNDGGIYKFVSTRQFEPGRHASNRRILTEGTLYVAKFTPEGRRRFATLGDTEPISVTSGTGEWTEVPVEDLVDTHVRLRARFTAAVWDQHYATNRPEDVEVGPGGDVFVALTNNTQAAVRDAHGSVRRMAEAGGDPTALTFAWEDYAAGGPRAGEAPSQSGFSSPDNLVFDSQDNLWVVTDISSSRLNKDNEYAYHANNAMFMVPTRGPNAGVAFRFANGPVEAELTGPYFTPDERTLFINVQHPGEETAGAGGVHGQPETYTSYWPAGNKTAGQNPSEPTPSLVAVTKLSPAAADLGSPVVPAPPAETPPGKPPGQAVADSVRPRVNLLGAGRQKLGSLRGRGIAFTVQVDERVDLDVTLRGRLRARRGTGRGKLRRIARAEVTVTGPGKVDVRLRPSAAMRALLRREEALPALLHVKATDAAGNVSTRTKQMKFS